MKLRGLRSVAGRLKEGVGRQEISFSATGHWMRATGAGEVGDNSAKEGTCAYLRAGALSDSFGDMPSQIEALPR